MLAGKSRTINDEEDKEHEDLNKQIREFFWDIICNTSQKGNYENEQIEFAIKKYSDLIKD